MGDNSVGELIGSVTRDLSTLLRQELELAKVEVKQEAVQTGRAAGLLGAAGFAGYLVVLFLSLALAAGLAQLMDLGWALVLVAAVWALAGGVLFSAGRRRLRHLHPRPERTVDTLQEVPDALRGR
ncbi:MAG: phage holin family protein [Actinobacteria bacterium]|nr:phage holin family protein [Actinomycetota bacterium]